MGSTDELTPVLQIENFSVSYPSERGWVQAVRDVTVDVRLGQLVGLAGESGSGKSTLVLAATGVLRPPMAKVEGSVRIAGQPWLHKDPKAMRNMRWSTFSFVTQSAMNALNPVLTIRAQMRDTMRAHRTHWDERAFTQRTLAVFEMVELPASKLDSYPHQLSGGMRQRAVIALSLLLEPQLIIMDEPTTALDVVVQREIITLIRQLQNTLGFAVLLITHDLSLLLEIAHEVGVLYGGKFMEWGGAEDLVRGAYHPYSRALMSAFPTLHGPVRRQEGITGVPPDMVTPPQGCPFAPRCDVAVPPCFTVPPELLTVGARRKVACHRHHFEHCEGGIR